MEQQILFLINRQWTDPGLDLFMAAMSSLALWTVPMIAAVVLVTLFGGFRARAMLLVIAVALGTGGGLLCDEIKNTVHRPRPRDMLADVRRVELQRTNPVVLALFQKADVQLSRPKPGIVTGHSFPSAHAYNNFCIAMILAIFYRRWGWLYFFPAAVVGYSRMYVGAHWPTDVLAGAFLGCGCALLTIALCEFLWRRLGRKIIPKMYAAHPGLLGDSVT